MTILHMLLLALIQGITEFLPISSSGHLILLPLLTPLPDQGPLMDVAVHVGTLLAVILYFWRDSLGLLVAGAGVMGVPQARQTERQQQYIKLLWSLIIATLPIVIFGTLLVKSGLLTSLRSASVIATTSIIFGLLLWWADRKDSFKSMDRLGIKSALIIGLSQIIALIPGTSRSGITMTAARSLGFDRKTAARFSMLLSIPTILAAGVLAGYEMVQLGTAVDWATAMTVAGMAFVFAIVAIHFLLKWLETRTMGIFVIYRVLLGLGLFALVGAGKL